MHQVVGSPLPAGILCGAMRGVGREDNQKRHKGVCFGGTTHLRSLRVERSGVWWGSEGEIEGEGERQGERDRVKHGIGVADRRGRPETHTFK